MPAARNSIVSNADTTAAIVNQRHASRDNVRVSFGDIHEDYELKINNLSPNDLEGMYAKVMKKNKLANAAADSSPPPFRKSYIEPLNAQSTFMSDPDITHGLADQLDRSAGPSTNTSPEKNSVKYMDNDYETIDKRRARGVNTTNYDAKADPAYETIPADLTRTTTTGKPSVSRNILGHGTTPTGTILFANWLWHAYII